MIDDQLTKEDLLERISRFLDERKDGKGNYAPVTDQELTKLYNIFYGLLGLKYAEDCDGDLPIQVKIIDKTKYQSLHFFPVPHLGLGSNLKEVEKYTSLAYTNLSMAEEQMRLASVHLKFLVEDQETQAKK